MPAEPVILRPDGPIARWKLRAWKLVVPRLPRAVMRVVGRLILRLPRGSRIRRWWVIGLAQIAWDATARSRYDLVLPAWDPDCEWRWDPQFTGLGFDEVYRGHDGVRRSLGGWNDVWDEVSFTVREVLDGGNTWVMHIGVSGRGAASGVRVEQDVYSVCQLDPLIVRFYNLADYQEALREAGFAEVVG